MTMLKTRNCLTQFHCLRGVEGCCCAGEISCVEKTTSMANTLDFTENLLYNGIFGLFLGKFIQANCNNVSNLQLFRSNLLFYFYIRFCCLIHKYTVIEIVLSSFLQCNVKHLKYKSAAHLRHFLEPDGIRKT